MNERNKGIFYGVVAIATLIVAIVGATLAYFSIYASSGENAVGFTSRVVSIDYIEGQNIIIGDELIPSIYDYVVTSYENPTENRARCIDDKGQKICAVYPFTIKNNADAVNLQMYLKVGLNEFPVIDANDHTNLKYMLYEVVGDSNRTNVYGVNGLNVIEQRVELNYNIRATAGTRDSLAGYDEDNGDIVLYPFASGQEKTFELVIYLDEIGNPQNDEQGKSFAGTIEVEVNDEITGCIGPQCSN